MNKTLTIKEFIWQLSRELIASERTMEVRVLAERLNSEGFRTRDGREYQGLRGTYRLVDLTYQWMESRGGEESAKPIAHAFVTPSGKAAWDR